MPTTARPTVWLLAVAMVWSLAHGPSAQTPAVPQPPEQRPTFRTEANFVRVDAYPMKDGKPVLDLTAADFELWEDGAAQKLEMFEHVVVRPAGAQSSRIEPSSQRETVQAAANPRNRVFVIFLDGPHVTVAGSHAIGGPLIRLINRILGPDDLVGVMTPTMRVSDLVLARRTEVTEEQLRKHWTWGERFGLMNDEREDAYLTCYPRLTNPGIADSLVARKRERVTLEALEDLVRHLSSIREERKAILTVTEGWALFTPDPSLEKLFPNGQIPGVDPVGVGLDGKLTTKDPRNMNSLGRMDCNADRMRLAAMDNERYFRDIVNDANRVNASFYPIDPRGLAVFDTPLGPAPPLSLAADARSLKTRQESMRSLASGTDGLAVMDSNDLDGGLRRISDDLTSYYLLGYYSTNGTLDGGYRSLKVRVKRPGVEVRARRGYRAASAEDVARARKAAAGPAVDIATPIAAALGTLAGMRPDARLRLHGTASADGTLLWIAGELPPRPGRPDEWAQGGTADVQVTRGGASASTRVALKAGERAFLTSLKLPPGAASDLDVQARVASTDSSAPAAIEGVRVPPSAQPLFYRRGPSTANRQVPTADQRFTRAERAHLELPISGDVQPGAARLLDRTGQPLTVPVTVSERIDEASGQRWLLADVVLAPLAPGDFIVELSIKRAGGESRVLAGLRIVR